MTKTKFYLVVPNVVKQRKERSVIWHISSRISILFFLCIVHSNFLELTRLPCNKMLQGCFVCMNNC